MLRADGRASVLAGLRAERTDERSGGFEIAEQHEVVHVCGDRLHELGVARPLVFNPHQVEQELQIESPD